MKYHNIPFYIAGTSITQSQKIGRLLSRKLNTEYRTIDIPDTVNFLKTSNNFTCFIFELANNSKLIENITKSIIQKNPNFPIILISDSSISLNEFRRYIKIGVADILVINPETNPADILDEVLKILTLKWRAFLHISKENEKIFQATVVTANHEINQPLTVIMNAIGLLNAELKSVVDDDTKVKSHLNFISKGINRIHAILDTFRNIKTIALKEYTDGIWMINLDAKQPSQVKNGKMKINNKNTVLVIKKNMINHDAIVKELKRIGLEIISIPDEKSLEEAANKSQDTLRVVLLSADINEPDLKESLAKLNNISRIIPVILIRNIDSSLENLSFMDTTHVQVLNEPFSSRELYEAIINSTNTI